MPSMPPRPPPASKPPAWGAFGSAGRVLASRLVCAISRIPSASASAFSLAAASMLTASPAEPLAGATASASWASRQAARRHSALDTLSTSSAPRPSRPARPPKPSCRKPVSAGWLRLMLARLPMENSVSSRRRAAASSSDWRDAIARLRIAASVSAGSAGGVDGASAPRATAARIRRSRSRLGSATIPATVVTISGVAGRAERSSSPRETSQATALGSPAGGLAITPQTAGATASAAC